MVPVSPALLSSAVTSIYDAAYGPGTWDAAIGNLGRLFHGSKACFGRFGPDLQPNDVVATNNDPAFQRRYIAEHASPSNVLTDAMIAAPVGLVYGDHALVGDGALRRSRLWNEWMAPQDMHDGIGCKVLESGPSFWMFDVQRGRTQAAFEAADAELLGVIAPHLARAVQIGRQFQSSQLLAATFSHLPFGVILVDASLRIETLNTAAEAILLRAGSALVRKSGRLAAADAASTAALQRLVAQACTVRGDVIPGVGGDLLLRRKRGGRDVDLALSVGPLLNTSHGLPSVERPSIERPSIERPWADRHAAIFVREISLDLPARFAEQARALFALSPKEASLATSLASGRTLKQAADDNRIALSTARSYLETIFRKTGTRQQSHLVALLKSAQAIARNSG
jgi:DNA-binding CsgD family transcriptional regulator/PAS domain-containing protein